MIVTVPSVTPARFKELMEWGVGALPGANGRFPQIAGYKMTVDTTKTAQVQDAQFNVTTPGQRITSLTLDDGRKIVENGALVPGAPNVNLATTNFTAANGNSYPFRDLKGVAAGVPYQQSLFDFITKDLGRRHGGPLPGGRRRADHDHAVGLQYGHRARARCPSRSIGARCRCGRCASRARSCRCGEH